MTNPSISTVPKEALGNERIMASNFQSFLPYAINQQLYLPRHMQQQQAQDLQRQNMRLSQYTREQDYMSNNEEDVMSPLGNFYFQKFFPKF